MPGQPYIFRTAAIVVLVATFIATLGAMNRRSTVPDTGSSRAATAPPPPDDLSAELRRCDALGPNDAEDPRCVAVWEENRLRFFGRPARPFPVTVVPAPAAAEPDGGGTR